VLTTWHSRYTDIDANNAVADGNRLAKARLDRRLDEWRTRYPDLDVEAVAVHGSALNYFTREADTITLLVIGHERADGIRELVGPPGYATLHQAGCSVLVCQSRNVL
jgi:nucleotide-binding universal stress UspA family protein